MNRKIIAAITILAVAVSTTGCTHVVTVAPEKNVKRTPSTARNIVEARLSEGITGVTLDNWEVISFDSLGGKYNASANTISGTDVSGRFWELQVGDLRDVSVCSSSRIEFDANKGWIDPSSRQIEGTTKDGDRVQIPLDDVLYYKVEKVDVAAICLLTGGISLVLVTMVSCWGEGGTIGNAWGDMEW